MNNSQSAIRSPRSKVAIAGAGPAGASLAIRLATSGIETILIERERFPRQKLCGEFISPECLKHFEQLGVLDGMLAAGGDRVLETRFFESGGRSVAVPTQWFGEGDFALSLSRAEMDNQLLNRAKEVGVAVLDGNGVTDIESEDGRVVAVRARAANGDVTEINADLFIDATGRSRILTKLVEKKQDVTAPRVKPGLVGFKAHLRDVDLSKGLCEIYSFPGGYAGLSHVEDGLFNLCFLIKAATVRSIGSDAVELVKQVVTMNKRAAVTLREASASNDWLAVSIDSFGKKNTSAATNLFTIGDAAAFIDPFTGSGMVMAFESAGVLAEAIFANPGSSEQIAKDYRAAYERKFANRLRVCSILRRTAFMPNLATAIVTLLGISENARRSLARATRGGSSVRF
jgi:flavin-dependent dehydrogenase